MGNLQPKTLSKTEFGDFKPNKKSKPKRKPKGKCKTYLEQKIALYLSEYKKGNSKFATRQQALAAAYSQVKKEHSHCRRFLEKK